MELGRTLERAIESRAKYFLLLFSFFFIRQMQS